jgi:hypothetical protein
MCVRLDAYFRCFCTVLSKTTNLINPTKNSTLNFHTYAFGGIRAVLCGQTDGHEEAKSRFSQLVCELSLKKKDFPEIPTCWTSQCPHLKPRTFRRQESGVLYVARHSLVVRKHQVSGIRCRVNLYTGTELNCRRSFLPLFSIYSLDYTENGGSKAHRTQEAVYQTTGRHIAKGWNLHQHSCENLPQSFVRNVKQVFQL